MWTTKKPDNPVWPVHFVYDEITLKFTMKYPYDEYPNWLLDQIDHRIDDMIEAFKEDFEYTCPSVEVVISGTDNLAK